jgi:quinol-cytochrome oxidoreductase complex cytochrome b subunit
VADESPGTPFYPDHLFRILIVSALVLAIAVSLAAMFPRAIGDPATPFELPDGLVSSWIVVDVSLGLIRTTGVWGFVGFSALGLLLVILPLVDRDPGDSIRRKPLVLGVGLLFFLGFLAFWTVGRQIDAVPPSAVIESSILDERAVPTPDTPDSEQSGDPETRQEP